MAALSAHGRHWRVRPRLPESELRAFGVEPLLVAQLLANRGLRADDVAAFLDPTACDPADSWRMSGVSQAVLRIGQAREQHERVGIFGDYDVDGLSGSAILERTFTALGLGVTTYIPDRLQDGYGVTHAGLRRLASQGVTLVVSVDCGIGAHEEVAQARDAGLDVIITDHHQLPSRLPDAVAVLNPRQPGCSYPWKELSGAGVAYTLARALLSSFSQQESKLQADLSQLAALGTVADVMSLRGENRGLVARGLAALRASPLMGLRALLDTAGRALGEVDAETLAFVVAPRLNAAGRMGSAEPSRELLVTNDLARASELAAQLEALNRQRQAQEREYLERARQVVRARKSDPAHVVAGDYPFGLVGLLAGRLAEETARPTVVLSVSDGIARGSARGPADVDVLACLAPSADLLTRFGGHGRAAGLTLDSARIQAFVTSFQATAGSLRVDAFQTPTLDIDCHLRPASVNVETLRAVSRMEPFGADNPRPTFLLKDMQVRTVRVVGGDHLRLQVVREGCMLRGIAFRGAADPPAQAAMIDLAFRLRSDNWNGEDRVELDVLGWRPTL